MPTEITLPGASSGDQLHVLTFAKLKRAAQHALTKRVADADDPDDATEQNVADLVNDALMRFASEYPWRWLRRAVALDSVADQPFIALPDDLGAIRTVESADGWTARPTALERIVELRARAAGTGCGWLYCVTYAGQAADNAIPRPRLELFPTPAENVTGAFQATYSRIVKKLTDDDQVPDMPPPMHQALKAYVRAHALLEDHQPDGEAEMGRAQQLIAAMLQWEGGQQANLGAINEDDADALWLGYDVLPRE